MILDFDGPVFVADYGLLVNSRADAVPVVCLHGLGGSSVAWRAFALALGPGYRVFAIDLPGHGQSPAAGRSLAPPDLADLVCGVIRQLQCGPVRLVGHSMGAAVSIFAASSAPTLVEHLLLLAPPLPRQGLGLMSPSLVRHVALCTWPRAGLLALQRRRARHGVDAYIAEGLRFTCGDRVDVSDLASELARDFRAVRETGEDPLASFIQAARSVGLLVAAGGRYRGVIQSVGQPTAVMHGTADRVIGAAGLRQLEVLQPSWSVRLLRGVAHSPHVEVPQVVAETFRALGCVDSNRTEPAPPVFRRLLARLPQPRSDDAVPA
jgi:pimeloyl-ACP methyl ester carboxylesterase